MNKEMSRLRVEIENNKSGGNPQMSVLSVPSMGVCIEIKKIKNMVKNAYIPTDNTDIGKFIGENLHYIDFSIIFNRRRKRGENPPMSALSVPSRGACVEINRIKIMVKNAYIPTDNTDIGRFTKKNLQVVDIPPFFSLILSRSQETPSNPNR